MINYYNLLLLKFVSLQMFFNSDLLIFYLHSLIIDAVDVVIHQLYFD